MEPQGAVHLDPHREAIGRDGGGGDQAKRQQRAKPAPEKSRR